MQPHPPLIFACELDIPELVKLFSRDAVLDSLKSLEAGIAMGLRDLTPQRAEVVQKLNQAGIPVTAWLLLPIQQGYWFNLDNFPAAEQRYRDFLEWSSQFNLTWQRVGLDIEPDIHFIQEFKHGFLAGLSSLVSKARKRKSNQKVQGQYLGLVHQIRRDGFEVESYQFPFILDARRTNSHLLQALSGILDLPVDHEVLMLYSSFERPFGPALLRSYGIEAQAVGIGSTGGGVDLEGVTDTHPMTWDEFKQDLLSAGRMNKDIFVFSLEGCLQQGYLEKLGRLDWDERPRAARFARQVGIGRDILQGILWLSARPWIALFALPPILIWIRRKRQ